MRFAPPQLDDSPVSVPESPFAPPKPIDPLSSAPVQQNAFSPPPLNSVPLMQVPDLSSDQSLEDMILKAQPEEVPFGTSNEGSARHRTVRRADFTRPRIPGLQQESSRHITQETPVPKSKRKFGQKLGDFFKQLNTALKSLFRD